MSNFLSSLKTVVFKLLKSQDKLKVFAGEDYLYRALNPQEVKAGFRLLGRPNFSKVFDDSKPMFVIALPSGTYAHTGGPAETILDHEAGSTTNGVSTTKSMKAAIHYAKHNPQDARYIVRIRRGLCRQNGIKEWDKNIVGLRANKNDDEVILVSPNEDYPANIIDELFRLNEDDQLMEIAIAGR